MSDAPPEFPCRFARNGAVATARRRLPAAAAGLSRAKQECAARGVRWPRALLRGNARVGVRHRESLPHSPANGSAACVPRSGSGALLGRPFGRAAVVVHCGGRRDVSWRGRSDGLTGWSKGPAAAISPLPGSARSRPPRSHGAWWRRAGWCDLRPGDQPEWGPPYHEQRYVSVQGWGPTSQIPGTGVLPLT